MLYSDNPRVHYKKAQLAEAICQFRFPTILSIGAREPVDFQEAIRSMFPRYAAKQEQPAPRIANPGTPQAKLETPSPIVNYNFVSADGRWKLNLTSSFISLSTVAYPGWEEFGQHFDLPLAQSISPPSSSASACGMSTSSPGRPWSWRESPGGSCSPRPTWASSRRRTWTRAGPASAPWMWIWTWTAPAGPGSTRAPAW